MTSQCLTIVSADCHAGPERMADFRPYIDAAHLAGFDDYCRCIDAYERDIGSGLTGGGATSTGENGLWDHAVRAGCLDGDGVAAEVIIPEGSVPYAD